MNGQSASKHVLIITEKPDAAERIAVALDRNRKPTRKSEGILPYFIAIRDKNLIIVPALGHLYTVGEEKETRKRTVPAFDFAWLPRYLVERGSGRIRPWIAAIEKLAKNAEEFVDACDYDIEGSIIGYNILKHACHDKEKIAKRMKYSTLTDQDLLNAYESIEPNLDFKSVEAGLTRHEVDWIYGINLSRALTNAVRTASGRYRSLSTGRVQGPTLKLVVRREKKVRSFLPSSFWTVKAQLRINEKTYDARFEKERLETEDEANLIVNTCRNQAGTVERIESHDFFKPPPFPFDLGTLQSEAYRLFRITPKQTAEIAQKLYLYALISYPRTSSQKFPPSMGYRTILQSLKRIPKYKAHAEKLLSQSRLQPTQGNKTDPAHPAIYPTGKLPGANFGTSESALWNLIVRRFMASFGESALKRDTQISVLVKGYRFTIEGITTLKEGWYPLYGYQTRENSEPIPNAKAGQHVLAKTVVAEKKLTKPLPRYSPASLLRKMERANIGTKATRADIIQTLYIRKYIKGNTIEATDLGIRVVDTLNKCCPAIISVRLTRQLERKMEQINTATADRIKIVEEAKETLKPALQKLRENEKEIGKSLSEAVAEVADTERTLGECPNCNSGKLIILRSKKTAKRFIGCTNYFKNKCRTSAPLPQKGMVKPMHKNCVRCGWPLIRILTYRRRFWRLCTNPNCPTKESIQKMQET